MLRTGVSVSAARSDTGFALLHSAVAGGDEALSLQLLRNADTGVNARAQPGAGGALATPLTPVIVSRRLHTVHALLEEGADTACLGLWGPCQPNLAASDSTMRRRRARTAARARAWRRVAGEGGGAAVGSGSARGVQLVDKEAPPPGAAGSSPGAA